MKNNPGDVHELRLAKELLLKIEFQDSKSGDERYNRVLENVLAGRYSDRGSTAFKRRNILGYTRKYLKVAAVLLLAGFLFIYYYNSDTTFDKQVVTKSEIILKENPAGRKSQVFLPDGTVVWLNSESRVTYVVNIETNKRIVNLVGEAFFDVAKDKDRPFIVKTSNCSIEAIGTQFNVKAYPEDLSHHVSLAEGIVSVLGTDEQEPDGVILKPGESLSVNEQGRKSKTTFNQEVILGWRIGILHFEGASLSEVIHKLERWYGKEFLIEGSSGVGDWSFTSEFHNETLENVLRSMSYAKGFDYQIDDKSVKLIFNEK
ncbi:MAG: FecR domain-containing protein [Cyclobacteriaceae bacterium]|nr:FecR domain-containing protein [Cyclobacteriaceae bacterium SS2]